MRFLYALTLSVMMLAGFAAPASAAETIAVLNVQEIMRDSAAAKSIKSQFEAKQKSFSSDVSTKEQALQKEQQELGKQRAVLAKEAFDKKVQEFNAKASAMQKEVQGKRQALDKGLNQAFGEVQKTVNSILADMAKEKGFIVVLPTQQTLYSAPSLDVTADVLSKLNAKLPSVSVKF